MTSSAEVYVKENLQFSQRAFIANVPNANHAHRDSSGNIVRKIIDEGALLSSHAE